MNYKLGLEFDLTRKWIYFCMENLERKGSCLSRDLIDNKLNYVKTFQGAAWWSDEEIVASSQNWIALCSVARSFFFPRCIQRDCWLHILMVLLFSKLIPQIIRKITSVFGSNWGSQHIFFKSDRRNTTWCHQNVSLFRVSRGKTFKTMKNAYLHHRSNIKRKIWRFSFRVQLNVLT